ncbi:MAG: ABC transporter permease [Verrucomicrobiaceae bacterium]|nr:ABC transporter permease [Verrucomicrobiaceae bacterium]
MRLNRSNACWLALACITGAYIVFWLLLLGATATYSTPHHWLKVLQSPEIRQATFLSLVSCTAAAAFALLLAVPVGYLMSRKDFRFKALVDAMLDIPIILPPLVVGLCLLIFFQTWLGKQIESVWAFTYTVSGVVLAQFVVAASFAIRTMRGTFDHLSPRPEEVALTLGCTRFQALWHVAMPAARRGMVAAFCIAWARSLGEFGPILVFAGATRMKTEVLPTTVWLELSVGNLEAAVAVSLLMVAMAMLVLIVVRTTGEKP